jgi:hypothetical protein
MDEGQILDEALANLPCELRLQDYNSATSLQARLNRYIKTTKKDYKDMGRFDSPFDNLVINLIKPNILRFELLEEIKMKPLGPSITP